jgi:hypothetical protein
MNISSMWNIYVGSNITFHEEISAIDFSKLINVSQLNYERLRKLNCFVSYIAIFVFLASKMLGIVSNHTYNFTNGNLYYDCEATKMTNIPLFFSKSCGLNFSVRGMRMLHLDFVRIVAMLLNGFPSSHIRFNNPHDLVCISLHLHKYYLSKCLV